MLFRSDNSIALEQRITLLHDLGRKHNCQITELLDVQHTIEVKLDDLDTDNLKLDSLVKELSHLESEYFVKSKNLSTRRLKASKALSKEVTNLMQNLGMPGSEIVFNLTLLEREVRLNGAEDIHILVKTNAGQDFKPLNKVASEIGRASCRERVC